MARPTFRPTQEQREQVKKMAALGMSHDVISEIVGITPKTLRKYLGRELKRGDAEGKLRIASRLMSSVDGGNVKAQIYLARIRLGWREDRPISQLPSPPSFIIVPDSQPAQNRAAEEERSRAAEPEDSDSKGEDAA